MKKLMAFLVCILGCIGCATTHTRDIIPYEGAVPAETTADAIAEIMSTAAGATGGALIGDEVSDGKYAPTIGAYLGAEAMRGLSRWNISKRNAKWKEGYEAGKRAERLSLLKKMQPGKMVEKEDTSEYMSKSKTLKRIPKLELDGVKYDSHYKELEMLR